MSIPRIENYILSYIAYTQSKSNIALLAFGGTVIAAALAVIGYIALQHGWIAGFQFNTLTSAALSTSSGLGFLVLTAVTSAIYYVKTVPGHHQRSDEEQLLAALSQENMSENRSLSFHMQFQLFLIAFGKENWQFFLKYVDEKCFKNAHVTYSEECKKNIFENLAVEPTILNHHLKELETTFSDEFKEFQKKIIHNDPSMF
jgi:hypothetical protein